MADEVLKKMAVKIFLLFFLICNTNCQLQKVLVLGRHNLRTPLTESLSRLSAKPWPKWSEAVGSLTKKGWILENQMGKYFGEWLAKEGLITGCPEENEVLIYANSKQRTKATALAFSEAFNNCSLKVQVKNLSEPDPVFDPILRNDSQSYKETIKREMIDKINSIDLQDVYEELNRVTDLKNSDICKEDLYCDLTKDKNEVVVELGKELNVTGPLFIGTAMVDSFLMSYYEGMPMENVAWGEIKTDEQWRLLTKIAKENLNVRFNLTVSKDLAAPLLSYMRKKMFVDNEKFVFLVAHDANMRAIFRALEFDPFELPEQFELTPVGGKLVFQKWRIDGKDFLKLEFVYQSTMQLRNGEVLSLNNPPKRVVLSLKNCKTDENGYCPWEQFVNLFNNVTE